MKLGEVHRVLKDIFNKELTNGRKRHIVFWYDEDGEFTEDIDDIQLENVRKWQVTENNLFATKYELEKNDPTSHFLIYANRSRPLPREDWLYDQFKLGYEFATDKTTVTMRELGITDDALRETFKGYKTFFNNKARFQAFRKFDMMSHSEEAIDLTVLAVLCKSPTNNMDDIVKTLFQKFKENGNTVMENISKYGNEVTFWELVEKYYGYTETDKSLQSLLTFFILTYLFEQNQSITFPENWKNCVSNRPTNVVVFMDQWMNHREDRELYNDLADQVAEGLRVNDFIDHWDVNDLVEMDAFRIFDKKIIQFLVEQLMGDLSHFDYYSELILTRRRLHWYPEFKQEYEAIYQAVQLIRKLHEMDYFIPEQSTNQMFESYANDYYVIDTAYRKFYIAYDQIEINNRLHPLREKLEKLYTNRFVEELAIKWSQSLERSNDSTWPIAGIPQQKDFYLDWIKAYQNQEERVFVIISDALRYEIAKELMDVLNNERKASTTITAIQGILPSFTALGMASLLPYKQMEYTDDASVVIDGTNTAGKENRQQILAQTVGDSLAIHYQDIVGMNRATLRETVHGKRIVYIYHNTIDARGDNAATEMEVFDAAEDAINDIRLLVNRFVTDISASNILITADHGFLYQRNPLDNSQKLPNKAEESVITKRRFSLSEKPRNMEGTLTYPMDYLLTQDKQLFVTVPKGVNRFAVQGAGANYVHGGAMLQEIVVPVITFKNDRSKSSANQVKRVDLKLTTPTRKITNTITYLEFFQTEKVEDKRLPRRFTLYFVDEDGVHVSNENIIIADNRSSQAGERTTREKFVFKSMMYDKRKTYYLVMKDNEDGAVYERYAFTIDIVYLDGFGGER
ncbi:BREX-1 system phosphatase PglZ type A [Oceanobacillus arenosus]|uniref:BREX-1 system phosphatase PglZ type A n=1 Tax=Oceanobacillus arenosus TaxID=1229153 RepID=A0A3D8PQQ1_9BACI|nr:BREX-1 system phosphatase PglZ type A [Oceanobacillus arenosus]RDW17509.1 BREX-1 system phosphatase PglZ type A [Oceanobacillus arenosus]